MNIFIYIDIDRSARIPDSSVQYDRNVASNWLKRASQRFYALAPRGRTHRARPLDPDIVIDVALGTYRARATPATGSCGAHRCQTDALVIAARCCPRWQSDRRKEKLRGLPQTHVKLRDQVLSLAKVIRHPLKAIANIATSLPTLCIIMWRTRAASEVAQRLGVVLALRPSSTRWCLGRRCRSPQYLGEPRLPARIVCYLACPIGAQLGTRGAVLSRHGLAAFT